MPKNRVANSTEDLNKADQARLSDEEISASTEDSPVETNGEDEEIKEGDSSSTRPALKTESGPHGEEDAHAMLMQKMIKLQEQVDEQKSLEEKDDGKVEEEGQQKEDEEEYKEGSEETEVSNPDSNENSESTDSSENGLNDNAPKEIKFQTVSRIEDVASSPSETGAHEGAEGGDATHLAITMKPPVAIEDAHQQSEREAESQASNPPSLENSDSAPQELAQDKILQRIAAIEKYRKVAESNSSDDNQLPVRVVEKYKVGLKRHFRPFYFCHCPEFRSGGDASSSPCVPHPHRA